MLTTKNGKRENGKQWMKSGFPGWHVHVRFILLIALAAALAGCKPPGPKALWDGREFLIRGDYADAVEKLKTAAALMNTNAQVWNYLGLAYHQAGRPAEAADAYRNAIARDQNLVEAHYNLGCLWLEQNRPDLAKADLTAYTLRRGDKSPEGWVKLGEAELRLRDLAGAEKSFNQARQFDAQDPEALNDLGVIEVQHNRASEAAQFFNAALRAKPDYAPAVLNLAVVSELYLNNRQYALQRYQDYLALKPRPVNWDAAEAAARALERELHPVPVSVASRPPASASSATQAGTSGGNTSRTPGNPPARAVAPKQEPPAVANPKQTPPSSANPVEVVQLAPEPTVHAAQDSGSTVPAESDTSAPPASSVVESPKMSDKHSFLSRVNPVNLFRSNPKTNPPAAASATETQLASANPEPQPEPVSYPRYSYRYPRKPAAGNRSAAQKAFVAGAQAQQAGQLSEAGQAYRKAIQDDPAYFDPYYNLGVVSVRSGDLPLAFQAYETALAIEPASHDARFNFALALKQANYPVDAANELEKLIARFPKDAYAHYALGSLYAQELRQPAKARDHFQKVLDLDPTLPQAASVHDWLSAHPR